MPRFDFAPDEWPPMGVGEREGLADAVFEVDWNGCIASVMAREVRCAPGYVLLFFRRAEDATTWAVGGPAGHLHPFQYLFGAPSHEKEVARALEGSYHGRTFLFQNADWLFLHASGEGGSWNGAGTPLFPARFSIPESATLESTMAQSESDAQFAWAWSRLSLAERARRASLFTRGNWDETQRVVNAIARVCRTDRKHSFVRWSGGGFSFEQRFAQPDARLRRWNAILLAHFEWQRDALLSARHVCVADSFIGPQVELQLAPPTHHELLEAALFLRDWARDKIPPDELRLLIPKL